VVRGVERHQVVSQAAVEQLVLRVQHQEDEVEPRHEGVREHDVLDDGLVFVPLRFHGIRGGQDGSPGVQLANDARLGDAQRLLFHHLENEYIIS